MRVLGIAAATVVIVALACNKDKDVFDSGQASYASSTAVTITTVAEWEADKARVNAKTYDSEAAFKKSGDVSASCCCNVAFPCGPPQGPPQVCNTYSCPCPHKC